MMKSSKKGFNLIEIAIVLAVIGLVIGGIYVAASSVTSNQRKQKCQTQLLQIVQNVRTIYSTLALPGATTLTGTQMVNARIAPADMPANAADDGVTGAYGDVKLATLADNTFTITMSNVDPGACNDFLLKNFGSKQAMDRIGLVNIKAGATTFTSATMPTLATATTACGSAPATMVLAFGIRG